MRAEVEVEVALDAVVEDCECSRSKRSKVRMSLESVSSESRKLFFPDRVRFGCVGFVDAENSAPHCSLRRSAFHRHPGASLICGNSPFKLPLSGMESAISASSCSIGVVES